MTNARRPGGGRRLAAVAMVIASVTFLPGCAGPGYYTQAVSGHLSLMGDRQDIDTYLAEAANDDPLAERIRLARTIVRFAHSNLGLPAGQAYSEVVMTGQSALVWNVIAAPARSLAPKKWCFIVAGCVPYRGYYDRGDAQRFADRMRGKGYDVVTAPATAYSTLGWFDDPLLDTMLNGSDPALAGVLFHELAHRRLYVPGDTAFNESYASFVEVVGVRRWLSASGREAMIGPWTQQRAMSAQWRRLVDEYRARLATLYAIPQPVADSLAQKTETLAAMRTDYEQLRQADWDGANPWQWFFDAGPNNAAFALVGQYEGGHCAFERLFESVDGDIEQFHRAAAGLAGQDSATRAEWLLAPCA